MGRPPKKLTPEAGPLHFWGSELREWRDKKGFSLRQLADMVHSEYSHLARIEIGERQATLDIAERCDRGLDANGALIRLYSWIFTEARWIVADPPTVVADLGSSLAISVARPELVVPSGELTIPVRAADGRFLYVRAALDLVSALAVRPHDLALNPVQHFARSRRLLADLDNLVGPTHLISVALEQINLVHTARQGIRQQATEWFAVLAEFGDLLGWLHQDLGEINAARYWLDRALEWAFMSGDTDSAVFIMARKAQLAGDARDGVEAVEMSEAAIRISKPRSRLAAIAATYGAHGHALLGRAAESERAYDAAQALLAASEPDGSPWGEFFDERYVRISHAQSRSALGEYQDATAEYDSAIASLPETYRRDQGVYLAREARACAGHKKAERAALLGLQALSIGVETRSSRTLVELRALNSTFVSWRTTVPEVRQFIEAMSTTAQPTEN